MAEHLTKQDIERYHDRVLEPEALITLDEHLTECVECRRDLRAAGERDRKFFSFQKDLDSTESGDHLNHEQLAAFADGNLNPVELEIVQSHLAICGDCELLANDLVVFKDEILVEPKESYERAVQPVPSIERLSFAQRSAGFFKSVFTPNSPSLAFGMGALALIVLGLFVWLIVRTNRGGTTDPGIVQTASPAPSPANGAQVTVTPVATPTPTPQILLALNDGSNQVGIDERGNLVGLDNFPHRDLIKNALITEQAANLVAASGVGGQPGVLRSGPDEGPGFAPVSPVGKVIFSNKPRLNWSALEGAVEYRVEIYDSNFSLVASSPPLTSNSWNVPNALERGQVYSWNVSATKDGATIKTPVPPAPEAKFKTLDTKSFADVTAARKDFRSSHLALGVLYAQSGLLDDAEREFIALVKSNPQSTTASNLLANVRAAKQLAK